MLLSSTRIVRFVSRNWIVVAILVAGLIGGGYFAFGRGPKVAPPQIAEEGVEPDVLEAVREARNHVIASPSDAAIWGQYGMVLRAHSLHNEANIAFAEAQRRNPYDARWPYLIGEYLQSRDPEAALPFLRQAVGASSPKPEHQSMARLKLAEALLQRQDHIEAEKWFREQLGVRPNDMRASIGLGTTLLAQDKPDQALPYVKAAANVGAFRKRATTLLANLARLRGDTDAATTHEADANRMLEDEIPADPFVWDYMTLQVGRKDAFGRIGELEKANRIQETIPLLLDMTRKYPEAKTYFNLGVNLSALGDHRAAIGHFETTILLDPAHAKAHNSLGLSLAVVADTVAEPSKSEYQRRAIMEFDRAIELKSDFALPYIFKGQVLYARGDQSGAFDTLRKIVAIRPDVADAHATLIVLLEKAGRIAEAKSLLPAAERVVPLSDETFQAARLRLNSK